MWGLSYHERSLQAECWKLAPKTEITETSDPKINRLLQLGKINGDIEILYFGVGREHRRRIISPQEVLEVEEFGIYVNAFCHKRLQIRTFKVELITFVNDGLEDWKKAPITGIVSSADPTISFLLQAVESEQDVQIEYLGGSTPGGTRVITPYDIFEAEGFGIYIYAYCHKREQNRFFSAMKTRVIF